MWRETDSGRHQVNCDSCFSQTESLSKSYSLRVYVNFLFLPNEISNIIFQDSFIQCSFLTYICHSKLECSQQIHVMWDESCMRNAPFSSGVAGKGLKIIYLMIGNWTHSITGALRIMCYDALGLWGSLEFAYTNHLIHIWTLKSESL